MKRFMMTVIGVVAVLLITSHAYADIIPTATVLASVGPNASGSSSWNGYVADALWDSKMAVRRQELPERPPTMCTTGPLPSPKLSSPVSTPGTEL